MNGNYNSIKTRLMTIANACATRNAEALSSRTLKKNYIKKYCSLFELILDTISSRAVLNGEVVRPEGFKTGAEIGSELLKRIDRKFYALKLRELYDDGLVYFNLSSSGHNVQYGCKTQKRNELHI